MSKEVLWCVVGGGPTGINNSSTAQEYRDNPKPHIMPIHSETATKFNACATDKAIFRTLNDAHRFAEYFRTENKFWKYDVEEYRDQK